MVNNKIIGGISVMGFIAPNSIYDTYPVIDPLYGIDGLRNVNTINDMLLISEERKRAGMIVGVNGGSKFFKLKDIVWTGELSDWDEIQILLVKDNKPEVTSIDKEKPIGLMNGQNKKFILNYEPISNSEHLFLNGILQENGSNLDYIIDGKVIEFNEPPFENMRLLCSYRTTEI
jgi:hypothetical protein